MTLALVAAVLAAFGFWLVVGWATVSQRARNFVAQKPGFRGLVFLLECPTCLGFWEGVVLGASFSAFAGWHRVVSIVAAGCIIAATNTILAATCRGHLWPAEPRSIKIVDNNTED